MMIERHNQLLQIHIDEQRPIGNFVYVGPLSLNEEPEIVDVRSLVEDFRASRVPYEVAHKLFNTLYGFRHGMFLATFLQMYGEDEYDRSFQTSSVVEIQESSEIASYLDEPPPTEKDFLPQKVFNFESRRQSEIISSEAKRFVIETFLFETPGGLRGIELFETLKNSRQVISIMYTSATYDNPQKFFRPLIDAISLKIDYEQVTRLQTEHFRGNGIEGIFTSDDTLVYFRILIDTIYITAEHDNPRVILESLEREVKVKITLPFITQCTGSFVVTNASYEAESFMLSLVFGDEVGTFYPKEQGNFLWEKIDVKFASQKYAYKRQWYSFNQTAQCSLVPKVFLGNSVEDSFNPQALLHGESYTHINVSKACNLLLFQFAISQVRWQLYNYLIMFREGAPMRLARDAGVGKVLASVMEGGARKTIDSAYLSVGRRPKTVFSRQHAISRVLGPLYIRNEAAFASCGDCPSKPIIVDTDTSDEYSASGIATREFNNFEGHTLNVVCFGHKYTPAGLKFVTDRATYVAVCCASKSKTKIVEEKALIERITVKDAPQDLAVFFQAIPGLTTTVLDVELYEFPTDNYNSIFHALLYATNYKAYERPDKLQFVKSERQKFAAETEPESALQEMFRLSLKTIKMLFGHPKAAMDVRFFVGALEEYFNINIVAFRVINSTTIDLIVPNSANISVRPLSSSRDTVFLLETVVEGFPQYALITLGKMLKVSKSKRNVINYVTKLKQHVQPIPQFDLPLKVAKHYTPSGRRLIIFKHDKRSLAFKVHSQIIDQYGRTVGVNIDFVNPAHNERGAMRLGFYVAPSPPFGVEITDKLIEVNQSSVAALIEDSEFKMLGVATNELEEAVAIVLNIGVYVAIRPAPVGNRKILDNGTFRRPTISTPTLEEIPKFYKNTRIILNSVLWLYVLSDIDDPDEFLQDSIASDIIPQFDYSNIRLGDNISENEARQRLGVISNWTLIDRRTLKLIFYSEKYKGDVAYFLHMYRKSKQKSLDDVMKIGTHALYESDYQTKENEIVFENINKTWTWLTISGKITGNKIIAAQHSELTEPFRISIGTKDYLVVNYPTIGSAISAIHHWITTKDLPEYGVEYSRPRKLIEATIYTIDAKGFIRAKPTAARDPDYQVLRYTRRHKTNKYAALIPEGDSPL